MTTLQSKEGRVVTGKMFVTETFELMGPRWIVNFPTKQHWRNQSQMVWVTDGLQDLRQFIIENGVSTIAIPALGAGLGGLQWQAIKLEIETALSGLEGVNIFVYEPLKS